MPRALLDSAATRAALRRLYRDVDGFDIAKSQERRIAKAKSSATYGEIMPAATLQMLDDLALGPEDTFVDLGSGVAKVVLAAAIGTPVRRAVGVELAADRHERALSVVEQARAQKLIGRNTVELRRENILTTDLRDATVLYTCSTAFPYSFTHRLAQRIGGLGRALTFVTLQELDTLPNFTLERVLRLDMTWARRRKVHVYRVAG